MHWHLCARQRSCSPCQSSADYGNTKAPSMHDTLGGTTLSQLAFPGKATLISHGRNPVGTIQLQSNSKIVYNDMSNLSTSPFADVWHFAAVYHCTWQKSLLTSNDLFGSIVCCMLIYGNTSGGINFMILTIYWSRSYAILAKPVLYTPRTYSTCSLCGLSHE